MVLSDCSGELRSCCLKKKGKKMCLWGRRGWCATSSSGPGLPPICIRFDRRRENWSQMGLLVKLECLLQGNFEIKG